MCRDRAGHFYWTVKNGEVELLIHVISGYCGLLLLLYQGTTLLLLDILFLTSTIYNTIWVMLTIENYG